MAGSLSTILLELAENLPAWRGPATMVLALVVLGCLSIVGAVWWDDA